MEKERYFFLVQPYALASNEWSILYSHLSNRTHGFSPSTRLTLRHPFLKELNTNLESVYMWNTCVCVCADLCIGACLHVQVGVFSCDCVLVRWDVMWERLWQLHYLGGVSLSACARFLSLGPLSHSNIYLLPWRTLSSPFCLSVSELGLLYC